MLLNIDISDFKTRSKKTTPLHKFYSSLVERAALVYKKETHRIDITKFSINPKDGKRLKGYISTWLKNTLPRANKKLVEEATDELWLMSGPVETTRVDVGTVRFNKRCFVRRGSDG